MDEIANPSQTAFSADTILTHDLPYYQSSNRLSVSSGTFSPGNPGVFVEIRHGGTFNVLWGDGHGTQQNAQLLSTDLDRL
jgi:prepilin-type processing-associated H-X9-DG protein